MEIKKSKKLLKVLIATSFVGVVATPIMLTSCGKKSVNYADELLKNGVTFAEDEIKNQKDKKVEGVAFSEFDDNKTKTLACVVNDNEKEGKNKDLKSFVIKVTLPFEKDSKDSTYKFEHVENSVGAKKDKKYINVEEKVDEKNKKVVTYTVTVDKDIVANSEYNAKKDEKSKDNDKVKLSADKNYATITFKFTDNKDNKKVAEFTYKITFEEKEAKPAGN